MITLINDSAKQSAIEYKVALFDIFFVHIL